MALVTRTTLKTGDIPTAAEWNTQFDTIYTDYNGNIDNTNIVAGAGIVGSKLANGTVSAAQIADSTITDAKLANSYLNLSAGSTATANGVYTFPNPVVVAGGLLDSGASAYYTKAQIDALLEAQVFDANASEEVLSNHSTSSTTGVSASFTKADADKILRILLFIGTSGSFDTDCTINIGGGSITQTYYGIVRTSSTANVHFQTTIDISAIASGSVHVGVTLTQAVDDVTVYVYRNGF